MAKHIFSFINGTNILSWINLMQDSTRLNIFFFISRATARWIKSGIIETRLWLLLGRHDQQLHVRFYRLVLQFFLQMNLENFIIFIGVNYCLQKIHDWFSDPLVDKVIRCFPHHARNGKYCFAKLDGMKDTLQNLFSELDFVFQSLFWCGNHNVINVIVPCYMCFKYILSSHW